MDRADAIACLQVGRYMPAVNFIIKGLAKEKVHELGQRKREQVTTVIARLLKQKHSLLKARDIGLKSKDIAEQVYDETILELSKP